MVDVTDKERSVKERMSVTSVLFIPNKPGTLVMQQCCSFSR